MARNRYGGKCYRCGLFVEPGTGHFEKTSTGWRVRHHDFQKAPGAVTCDMAKTKHDGIRRMAIEGEKANG